MPSTEPASRKLQDRAVLWSMGEICATDIVAAACDALVVGLDSPALRILAACTRSEAPYDVPASFLRHSTSWASPSVLWTGCRKRSRRTSTCRLDTGRRADTTRAGLPDPPAFRARAASGRATRRTGRRVRHPRIRRQNTGTASPSAPPRPDARCSGCRSRWHHPVRRPSSWPAWGPKVASPVSLARSRYRTAWSVSPSRLAISPSR